MQLRSARLCQDCEEIHEDRRCPVCASEAFAFITRWIPAPEGRAQPRVTTTPQAEMYRRLIADEEPGRRSRLLKQALIGLTTVGVAGWIWRKSQLQTNELPVSQDRSHSRQPTRQSIASGGLSSTGPSSVGRLVTPPTLVRDRRPSRGCASETVGGSTPAVPSDSSS